MEQSLVSIIMNCYNGQEFISEAIKSVLSQSYNNWELIFWDNCSTDNTPNIVKKFNDCRIKYFRSDVTTSLGRARNLALSHSQGEFIAFLDSDDIWESEKLEVQINIMISEKNVGFIYSNYIGFWKNGEFIAINQTDKNHIERFVNLIKRYNVGMSTAIVRKSVINSFNIKFDEKFSLIEDYDFFIRIAYFSDAFYCANLLVKYRMHSNSLTNTYKTGWAKEFYEFHDKLLELLTDKELILYSKEIKWIKVRAINHEIINYLFENKKWLALNCLIRNIWVSNKLTILFLGVILGYKRYTNILNWLRDKKYRIE